MDTGLYKSVVLVRALVAALARQGIERDRLFDGSRLDAALLSDGRARIPLEEFHALVERAIALTQDAGLGLTIGGHASDHMLQMVGQLVMACGTLREAIRTFERYRPLLGNTVQFDLIEEGELAYFVCTPLVTHTKAPEFEAEMVLSLVYRVARRFAILGTEDAKEIWFTHRAPPHAARYSEVFRSPVRFERPRNAVLGARVHLDMAQPYADPRLLEMLRETADRMLSELSVPSLPEQVRALLRYEVDLRRVDANRVAKMLRLQPRAFRRQLIRAQAPWSMLLDETRCRIALVELARGDVSIREVAERLGFSEQSAFNRAFKRWTGATPARYLRERVDARREGPVSDRAGASTEH